MKIFLKGLLGGLLLFYVMLCNAALPVVSDGGGRIHVTILHFNDIYEITPVSGGLEGGIARVATLRKQLLERNPNTITTLGGDLFSPSAIGTAEYLGDRLAGKQMVDVLNHFSLDYATFGNHEFDIKASQFFKRMSEAKFSWISSNVFDEKGDLYNGVEPYQIISFTDKEKEKHFRLGLFGITMTKNDPDFVSYQDPIQAAGEQIAQLEGKSDFIIALTHQSIDDDEKLVDHYPKIGMVLGGHEHINYQRWRGNFVPILKGDGNVRSVYVIDLYFDPQSGVTEVIPSFVPINTTLDEDPEIKAVVDKWLAIAFNAFRQQGLEPESMVTTTTQALDGLESHVRFGQTNLTQLIAKSMLLPYRDADLSLYNSGSIRIDDLLMPGAVSVYDVIRVMPFGGSVQLAKIKGGLLKKVLDQGLANKGSGGYLQSANTDHINGQWWVNGAVLDENQEYKLAINDFLAAGREQGLEYLNNDNPDFTILNDGDEYDIRKMIIQQMKISSSH